MRRLPLLLLPVVVLGCKPKDEPAASPVTDTATATAPAHGGAVAPIGGAAGGLTPIGGTDSVEGSGGGVNSSALDAAHRAAASSSAPSPVGETGE